jgi:dTDP-4-dehydrorhamnose 3,5-epimerase
MKATPTPLAGAFVLDVTPSSDERGFFARTYCVDELEALGLEARVIQTSISFNPKKGTLRGVHFQKSPHEELKIVRCTRGAVFDVIVDLRPSSPTFKKWFGLQLDGTNHRSLYIPRGVGHGVLTLADDTEVLYMMSDRHVPEAAWGVRWDDVAFGIQWPIQPAIISNRDRSYPDFTFDKTSP